MIEKVMIISNWKMNKLQKMKKRVMDKKLQKNLRAKEKTIIKLNSLEGFKELEKLRRRKRKKKRNRSRCKVVDMKDCKEGNKELKMMTMKMKTVV